MVKGFRRRLPLNSQRTGFRIRQNAARIYFAVCYDHDIALCQHHHHHFDIVCVVSNEGTFTPRVRSISVHCLQGLRSVGGLTISFAWYAIYTRYQSVSPLHVIANVLTAFTKDDPH